MEENKYIEGIENPQLDDFDEQDARELKRLICKFVHSYGNKPVDMNDQTWLTNAYMQELPSIPLDDARQLSQQTIETITAYNRDMASLKEYISSGKSKEEWFAEKTMEAAAGLSVAEYSRQVEQVAHVMENANAQMLRTISTRSGEISQAFNLDGFIAEQHHVNSFNAAAALQKSPYHAEVCVPEVGETYGKNSFDIVIKDAGNKIIHQYQSKYGSTARETIQMLKRGNYNNQTFLVPPEQVEQVQQAFPGKTVVSHIGGTDKVPISSKALSKQEAKDLQIDIQQNSEIPQTTWNSFDAKQLAKFAGKQIALSGITAAAIGTGWTMVAKIIKDEPIDTEEVVEIAFRTGTDAGVKTAVAGAMQVAAKQGVLRIIPPATPVGVIANMACMAVEHVKTFGKVFKGEISVIEALDEVGCNTVAMTYGAGWGAAGAVLGGALLGWIPVAGSVIGGVVGGCIGYMAGSRFGQGVYNVAKKMAQTAKKTARRLFNAAKGTVKSVKRKFLNLIGW